MTVAGGGGDAILLGGETQPAAPGNRLRLPQQFLQQRRRGASCGPRISSVNCTSPGITFTAPGAQRRVPTVATVTAALAGQVFHLHHPFAAAARASLR